MLCFRFFEAHHTHAAGLRKGRHSVCKPCATYWAENHSLSRQSPGKQDTSQETGKHRGADHVLKTGKAPKAQSPLFVTVLSLTPAPPSLSDTVPHKLRLSVCVCVCVNNYVYICIRCMDQNSWALVCVWTFYTQTHIDTHIHVCSRNFKNFKEVIKNLKILLIMEKLFGKSQLFYALSFPWTVSCL